FDDWMVKCFGPAAPLLGTPDYSTESAWGIVVDELIRQEFFSETAFSAGGRAWGMRPENFTLSSRSVQLVCKECHGAISIPLDQAAKWESTPCINYGCAGSYQIKSLEGDYFYKFYSGGDVQRIFAREHTGLLDRDTRERLELDFIDGRKPGAPNLLSSTPTLEMGIDVGDLSSVLLCSVPPKQSNYLQRVGRAGRRDGNSLVLAVANARPHDLFFYEEPEEMLQGEVNPPGCFLNAAAVLERHLFALAMDEWVRNGATREHIPYRLGRILNEMEKKDAKNVLFPHAFLEFYSRQRERLRDDFFTMFRPSLGAYATDWLTAYAEEGNEEVEGLARKLLRTLSDLLKERQALQNRQRQIRTRISEMQGTVAQGQHHEEELDDLKADLAGVTELIIFINEKDVYNFLTDEGLLPNYAFPEAGIELKSVILRKERRAGQDGEWQSRVYEYVRAAASAIGELVPASAFYAGGRRVVVDQVNLRLSQQEDWRFCDRCSHLEREGVRELASSCPRCGSTMWADAGQVRRMIRLKQVMATTMDRQSRSHDQNEEREPKFYQRNIFVEANESFVTAGYFLDDDKVPFGFDFLSKVTLREVNFGKKDENQQPYTLGGQEILAGGFNLCKGCGRTLEAYARHQDFKHAYSCPHGKAKPGDKHFFTACFLYREFSSEAVRILLPVGLLDIQETDRQQYPDSLG
ncbi:MAG: RNA helicase, partial [Methanothrix sp.]